MIANKILLKNLLALALLLSIYIPLILIITLGYEMFNINNFPHPFIGLLFLFLNPISSVIFWSWMLIDWKHRNFITKKKKVLWLFVFLITFAYGATFYFFDVYKSKK